MFAATTGTPAAIASSGGSGKPSASNDVNRRASQAWYHTADVRRKRVAVDVARGQPLAFRGRSALAR